MKSFALPLLLVVAAVALVGGFGFLGAEPEQGKAPCPADKCPAPKEPAKPKRRDCPRCPGDNVLSAERVGPLGANVGGRRFADGTPLLVDYPGKRHMENLAGNDGLGLCVYASNAMAMDWHGIRGGRDLLQFMTRRPGGGTPRKFDEDMKAFWASKGKPVPRYFHYEGSDMSVLDRAVSSGRMVCGTYCRSPTGRYSGKRTYHMVDWVHADGQRYAVLDNNFVGDAAYEQMSRSEAERCVKDERGNMWLVIFAAAPPPPPPHNEEEVSR